MASHALDGEHLKPGCITRGAREEYLGVRRANRNKAPSLRGRPKDCLDLRVILRTVGLQTPYQSTSTVPVACRLFQILLPKGCSLAMIMQIITVLAD